MSLAPPRYTLLTYRGERLYVEEPFPAGALDRRWVSVLEDGLRPVDLPDGTAPICSLNLPDDAWAGNREWEDPWYP